MLGEELLYAVIAIFVQSFYFALAQHIYQQTDRNHKTYFLISLLWAEKTLITLSKGRKRVYELRDFWIFILK